MTWLPNTVVELLDAALVAELSVIRPDGRPMTYPLIPFWDGERVLMTSSVLFSRKLEHLKANPRASVSLSDPVALGGRTARATILGDARVIDSDPHAGWESVLPLWRAKEPVIDRFLKARVAFPLFFERAVIEIVPRRVLLWPDGDTSRAPEVTEAPADGPGGLARVEHAGTARAQSPGGAGAQSRGTATLESARTAGAQPAGGAGVAGHRTVTSTLPVTPADGLERLAGYPFVLLTWVDPEGAPRSAAVSAKVDPDGLGAAFAIPAGMEAAPGAEVSLTGSHIRPQPGFGYDERRHVTVWGPISRTDDGLATLRPIAAWGWDEAAVPFPEYVERTVGQSRRYFDEVSTEHGRRVRPRLALGWLTFRATRLPFLSATLVPVAVGIAIAAAQGRFDLLAALITVVGAASAHLALNVANDVFDARSGADDANVNPTPFSGGSRVIQYGLVSAGRMAAVSAGFYALAIACGLVLLATHGSAALLVIGVLGILLSIEYTAPPLRLVHHGLGELTTAIGFGPLMLVGAYVVQTGGVISREALAASVPIALLVALILYVNEIPDRASDARAGKRTLPVRLGRGSVIGLYGVAAAAAFASVVLSVLTGTLPIPALAALLAVPLAARVVAGLRRAYDQPYGLMGVMATNIKLHALTGGLLLAAYVVVIAAGALLPGADLYVG